MNLDNLNKWLTLLANFGVVAGLILLAVEVRQNQTVLEQNQEIMIRQYDLQVVDGRQALANAADQFRLLVGGNSDAAAIWLAGIKGELQSELDSLRFKELCSMQLWNTAIAYRRLTVVGSHEQARDLGAMIRTSTDASPGFSACWERMAPALSRWEPGFVDAVTTADSNRP